MKDKLSTRAPFENESHKQNKYHFLRILQILQKDKARNKLALKGNEIIEILETQFNFIHSTF